MKLKFFSFVLTITLFGLCVTRKSGLYPDSNQDSDNEEEVQEEFFGYNYNEYAEVEQQQQNKKNAIYGNNEYQELENNENEDTQSQDSTNDNQQQEEQKELRTRHQYKLSFKRPYYYYNDTNIIPNWEYHGNAIPSDDMIRLVPSVPNRFGSIWSLISNQYDEWQVVFSIRISGRSVTGSQGLALFYTDHQLNVDTFYGGEHSWNGLAIIFDTLNLDKNSPIPTISVLYNDGNTVVQSQKDYDNLKKSACVADFRNSPVPIYVRVTYLNKHLKVEVDLSHQGSEYYECTDDEIDLPNDYVFGITAKTGDINPDDHDVISFDFYQLNPPPKENYVMRPNEEEIVEREGEFEIDEETLKNIKKVSDEVNKEQEKKREFEKEKMVDARSVYLTQFRILETVNRILSNVENSNGSGNQNNGNEIIDEINQRTDKILNEDNEMKELLENIKETVQYISENVERDSQKFEYEFNSLETKTNQKVDSEINKVLNELRIIKEENKKLKEGIRYLANNASRQPNIWLVVVVSFLINMLGIYIIVRVLPNRSGGDMFKTHNY